MRTTDRILVLCFCAVLMAVFWLGASYAQQTPKQVKLYTDAVEVLNLSAGAGKCSDQKEATTVRFRAKSEKPVDVMVQFRIGAGWVGKPFPNKSKGDEFESYMCVPLKNIECKVYSREAGSQQDWPNPGK